MDAVNSEEKVNDGEKLKLEMAKKDITVRGLAKKAGVNAGTITHAREGVPPTMNTADSIAEALDIEREEFFIWIWKNGGAYKL